MNTGAELGVGLAAIMAAISMAAVVGGLATSELQLTESARVWFNAWQKRSRFLWRTLVSFLDPYVTGIALLLILLGAVACWIMDWLTLGCMIIALGMLALWLAHELAIAPCYEEPPERFRAGNQGRQAQSGSGCTASADRQRQIALD